ncbi:hypothetical protein LTR08_006108 [Meristemomyces frigidus]|nr:hypothetical protein LTR08_006108 [Meristemomyces frigidus]
MPPVLLHSHHWDTHFLLTIILSAYTLATHLMLHLIILPTWTQYTAPSAPNADLLSVHALTRARTLYLYTLPKLVLTLMQVLFMYETRGFFAWQWWCLACLAVSWGSGVVGQGAGREGVRGMVDSGAVWRLWGSSWVGTAAVVGHAGQWLNKLQLTFTDVQYVDFFHAAIPACVPHFLGFTQWHDQAPAVVLAQMPVLRYLELWFHSTLRREHATPFPHRAVRGGPIKNIEEIENEYGLDVDGYPCRKAIVEYIMCFAYQDIGHVARINLTGYVKTSTRDRWLGVFGALTGREAIEKTIDERMMEIRSIPSKNLPPKCFCPLPCDYPDLSKALPPRRFDDVKRALAQYCFDHDDVAAPESVARNGSRAGKTRQVRYDDPYAWDQAIIPASDGDAVDAQAKGDTKNVSDQQ